MSSRSQDRQRQQRKKRRTSAATESKAARGAARPTDSNNVKPRNNADNAIASSPKPKASSPRPFLAVPAPHPTQLEKETFLKQCSFTFGRGSGPGGQHRNKVETAAQIVHNPTGVTAAAGERRSQTVNRHEAVRRLRLKLARVARCNVHRERYKPSELWRTRRQGEKMPVNSKHWDYPALLAEAMDVIIARDCDVAGAAGILGITMSQLTKLIREDKASFAVVNEGRTARGLPALRK